MSKGGYNTSTHTTTQNNNHSNQGNPNNSAYIQRTVIIMRTSAIPTTRHIIQVVVENKDTSRKSYTQTSGTNVLLFFCAQIGYPQSEVENTAFTSASLN